MSDINMTRGDTTTFNVEVTRFNPATNDDEIVDLTGAKVWFTAKKSRTDSDANALIALNSVSQPSQVIITALTGKVQITILPVNTKDLEDRWLRYDVQLKEASGVVTTISSGKLELVKDATIVQV